MKLDIKLRPYQQECVDILNEKEKGHLLVTLATGLGKSVIFSRLNRDGRVLLLSHRDELVRQPEKYFEGICSFGIEKGNEESHGEDVVSASVQTLCRDERLKKFSPDTWTQIWIDEGHHYIKNNSSYCKIIDYFTGAKKVIGFTATPNRGDKVRLSDTYDEIVFNRDLKWGIRNKYLSPIRAARVIANYSLEDIHKIAGDFSLSDIGARIDPGVVATAAKVYHDECVLKDKHVLVYCATNHCAEIVQRIFRSNVPEEGPEKVQMILGTTPIEERQSIYKGFMSGEVRCIVNCMVLTEGTDLPICDGIINLRPTANISLYQQIVGRGTRLYPGKDYLLVYDVLPEDEKSRKQLCSAPSLFGVEAEELNEKQRGQITEQNDLLEACEAFEGACVDIGKQMEVKVEIMDSFFEEASETLQKTQEEGLNAAFKTLEEKRIDDVPSIDFGELFVKTNPFMEERYEIHPDYFSSITVSEPDLMGDVTVTGEFSRSKYLMELPDFRHRMRDKDAVDLIRKICYIGNPNFESSWNKALRERWKKEKGTENQLAKFQEVMKKLGYTVNPEEEVDKNTISELIDYSLQTLNAKEFSDRFKKKPYQRKATTEKQLEQYRSEYHSAQVETSDEEFTELKGKVENLYEKKKEEEDRKRKLAEEAVQRAKEKNGYSMYNVGVNVSYITRREATEKQIGYIRSLVSIGKSNGIELDEDLETLSLSSAEATILIAIFKNIRKNLPENYEVVINMTSIRNEGKRIELLPKNLMMSPWTGCKILVQIIEKVA